MELSGRGRLAAIGITCVAVGAAFGPAFATAATSFKDVIVANADDDPVPIKAIDPIPVNGTVSVGNSPSVKVANAEPIPVAPVIADSPEVTTITQKFQLNFQGTVYEESTVYTVPDDKRLVVDFVSFYDQGAAPKIEEFRALAGSHEHYFQVSMIPGGTEVVSQPTKMVVEPGGKVSFQVVLDQVLGNDYTSLGMLGTWVGTLTDA